MIKRILNKLGYITVDEAKTVTIRAIEEAKLIKPGDELLRFAREGRKFGFVIVTPSNFQDKSEANAQLLTQSLIADKFTLNESEFTKEFLANIRAVDSESLKL